MYDAFYSPDAQSRNNPPQKDLASLTIDQFRSSVMDLLGRFRLGPGFDRPIKKNRNLLRSFQPVLVCLPASEKQRLTKGVRDAKAAHSSGVRSDLSENKIVATQAAMRGESLENKKAKLCAAC